jgi:hypothetical protein
MRTVRGVLAAAILVAAVLAVSGRGVAGISISVKPSIVCVEPDDVFSVFVWKDSVDLEFDGYQTVITFDPEMLELISAQEESVMTDSCWNRWWFPDPGPDSIFISHVLMCGGITVTGPGALSSLTFRALAEGSTVITQDYFWLTYQGYRLDDIAWHDGVVNIGTAGIDGRTGIAERLRIEAYPNPGRSFRIRFQGGPPAKSPAGCGMLDICDISGRVVRSLASGFSPAPSDELFWGGKCEGGSAAAPGVYFIRFTCPTECTREKIILLR